MQVLNVLSAVATIATAGVAVAAYAGYLREHRKRQRTLEDYLREEKLNGPGQGQRSVMHLMANLGMTEAQVLQGGFSSNKVRAVPVAGETGRAEDIMFEYIAEDGEPPARRGRARF